MPLLTELVSGEDGFCYKRGAPNGALPPGQQPIPPETAKNRNPQVLRYDFLTGLGWRGEGTKEPRLRLWSLIAAAPEHASQGAKRLKRTSQRYQVLELEE